MSVRLEEKASVYHIWRVDVRWKKETAVTKT